MNPLYEILPPAVRKYVYALASVALVVFALYQASDGDWVTFAAGLLTALTTATAASNTDV